MSSDEIYPNLDQLVSTNKRYVPLYGAGPGRRAPPGGSGRQRERLGREVVLPEAAGGFLGVGGDRRRQVEDAGEALPRVVGGPAWVAGGGEPGPRRPELGRHLLGGRERGRADQPGGEALVQVAESERPVKAVAGAQDAAAGG